eukprot:scaffold212875_cov46-Prasinocladus_malaysianus.AAC.1
MYCLCSSLLLVINKVTVQLVPLPGFVLFAQMAATAAFVKLMEFGCGIEVDRFEKRKVNDTQWWSRALTSSANASSVIMLYAYDTQVASFIPIVMGFVSMLFTNMKFKY